MVICTILLIGYLVFGLYAIYNLRVQDRKAMKEKLNQDILHDIENKDTYFKEFKNKDTKQRVFIMLFTVSIVFFYSVVLAAFFGC